MTIERLRMNLHTLYWTGVVLAALVLLSTTLALALRSDVASRPRVQALLISDQPMIVLHAEAEISSGISGLLARLSPVTIVEYDPVRNPGWALVEAGTESGWVPLDRLAELP